MGYPFPICGACPANIRSSWLVLVGRSVVATKLSRAVELIIEHEKVNGSSDPASLGFAVVVMKSGGIIDEGKRVIIGSARS